MHKLFAQVDRLARAHARRFVAVVLAVIAMIAGPVGFGLAFGTGIALVVFAGLCIAGALLLGWE